MFVRLFKSNELALFVGSSYHKVWVYRKGMKLRKGDGYIVGDLVYLYKGKLTDDKMEVGMYMKGGSVVIRKPKLYQWREYEKYYGIKNVIEMDVQSIFDDIRNSRLDDTANAEIAEKININADVFSPTINEDDDFLKIIVKSVILRKKINLKNYKDNFGDKYSCNNMKSSLTRETKMTVPNFIKWMAALGVKFRIIVEDDGTDTISPLTEPFMLHSDDVM